jgi:hypothetical protein
MRRRKLLVALAGLAVAVAAGAIVLWPREDRVTRANYDRIRDGMTRAEVEAILGPPGPPGDFRTGHGETRVVFEDGSTANTRWIPDDPAKPLPNWSRLPGQSLLWATWMSDSFAIGIGIDDSGNVVEKVGYPRRTTQGPLENLLWRAKRLWQRWFP